MSGTIMPIMGGGERVIPFERKDAHISTRGLLYVINQIISRVIIDEELSSSANSDHSKKLNDILGKLQICSDDISSLVKASRLTLNSPAPKPMIDVAIRLNNMLIEEGIFPKRYPFLTTHHVYSAQSVDLALRGKITYRLKWYTEGLCMAATYIFLAKIKELTKESAMSSASCMSSGLPPEVILLDSMRAVSVAKYIRSYCAAAIVEVPLICYAIIYGVYNVDFMQKLIMLGINYYDPSLELKAYSLHNLFLPHLKGTLINDENMMTITSKKEWISLAENEFKCLQPGKYYCCNSSHATALVVTQKAEVFFFDINLGCIQVNDLDIFEIICGNFFEEGAKSIEIYMLDGKIDPIARKLRSKL
ncbi:MAG: hypothetical protein P0S95_00500 [Rhabdochlamydiaceae bacterium]|nr:hypothetical protein [Candidatus Amphrikana amoebophyrae]